MPTHVLFITHNASRTGAPILLANLADLLHETALQEFSVSFLVKAPDYAVLERFSAYPCTLAQRKYTLKNKIKNRLGNKSNKEFFSEKEIAAALQGVDVVVSNTITNGDILPLIRQYFKGPVISYIHELEMVAESFSGKGYVQNVFSFSDHFMVPSMAVWKFLESHHAVAPERLSLFPYYIPDTDSRPTEKRESTVFRVGAAGTIDWRKAPDLFIQTAYHTFRQAPDADIRFVWMGATEGVDLIRLRNEVKKAGLESKVEFCLAAGDMHSFYASLDVFLLTSREDPYPLVVLEAAKAAVPTVCFNGAGGATEFIHAAQGGTRVPYLDTVAMAEAVLDYFRNPEKRAEEGHSAQQAVNRLHNDKPALVKRFRDLLSAISNSVKPA